MTAAAATALPPFSPDVADGGQAAGAQPLLRLGRAHEADRHADRPGPARSGRRRARRTTSSRAVGAQPTTTTAPCGMALGGRGACRRPTRVLPGRRRPQAGSTRASTPLMPWRDHLDVDDHGRAGDAGPRRRPRPRPRRRPWTRRTRGRRWRGSPGRRRQRPRPEAGQVDPLGQDPVALRLDRVDGTSPTSRMASARADLDAGQAGGARSTSDERVPGRATSARSGQVVRHAPQPVQSACRRPRSSSSAYPRGVTMRPSITRVVDDPDDHARRHADVGRRRARRGS